MATFSVRMYTHACWASLVFHDRVGVWSTCGAGSLVHFLYTTQLRLAHSLLASELASQGYAHQFGSVAGNFNHLFILELSGWKGNDQARP